MPPPPPLVDQAVSAPVRTRAAADVAAARERTRIRRLTRVAVVLAPVLGWCWTRVLTGAPLLPDPPAVDPLYLMIGIFLAIMLAAVLGSSVVAGRSPHVTFRPGDIAVGISDVRGLGPVTEEVRRTVELFLAGRTFRQEMGGTPRRGLLLEGPPGTGKTMLAKAIAREAGVPFLFVSATAFQSMYYGATSRKIRSYFAALRRAARREGGAIGFIEEIDAIATRRGGVAVAHMEPRAVACSEAAPAGGRAVAGGAPHGTTRAAAVVAEGVGGVVNELLVQMQSFDAPEGWHRLRAACVDRVNLLLPPGRQLPRPVAHAGEILLVAATNRAEALDPALLRPGRFDRRIVVDVPDRRGRREIIDYYLDRKAHEPELAEEGRRDDLAGLTVAYTPAMIENLLDEALIGAVNDGRDRMNFADVVAARLLVEVGLGHPVTYSERERRLIATHEAGHAVVAHVAAPHRRLEVLSIVKRGGALGMLAHGDPHDVHTRSRSELCALIRIAFGGQAAEEHFLGEASTGAAGDLAQATQLAAQMVGAAGMTGAPVSLQAAQGVSGDLVARVLADRSAREQLEELLHRERLRARDLVARHEASVAALRDALLERDELVGSQILEVLRSHEPGAGWMHVPEHHGASRTGTARDR